MARRKREDAAQRRQDERSESKVRITETLTRHIAQIAEEAGATAIFVYADALEGEELPLPEGLRERVFYVTRTETEEEDKRAEGSRYVQVPDVPLTRMGQIKIAAFLALSRGLIKHGDVVAFLSGIAESGTLDTLMVMEVSKEFEMFAAISERKQIPARVRFEVLERVIDLAAALGSEGREGKPVGALFVIGDTDRVLSLSSQLVLNPFKGYEEAERNILRESITETVKEFSTIDGAFVIRGDGIIESAGVFLKTAGQEESVLPQGLGARHHAAAAITAVTDSVAVSVSESTGTVCVFQNGSLMVEIEKPKDATLATPGGSGGIR